MAFANEADLLANSPSSITVTFGVNPYTSSSVEPRAPGMSSRISQPGFIEIARECATL